MINFATLQGKLVTIAGIAIVVVGIAMAMGSRRADYKETARTGVNVLAAVAVITIGATFALIGFGKNLLSFFGIHG
ncbi:MAG: hypothetical protein ABJA34_06400 [Pseudonocardiales bacterium]